MRKLHKKYIILSISLTFLSFLMGLIAIFVIDPAGIYNKFDLGLIKDEGLYNRTQKFVELNKVKPNTIMFGSSRVHFLNYKDVQKYTHDKVYNLALGGSTLEEQYYFLKYSLENFDIKTVVIGLNLYSFSEKLKYIGGSDFDKELFITGFNLEKQLKYLLEVPLLTYIKNYYERGWEEPLYENGQRTAYNQKISINNKPWSERKKEGAYQITYKYYLTWGDRGFNYLKEMVKLCKEHNVEFKAFTTAVSVYQLKVLKDSGKMDIYYKWKARLAQITPYWDFMYVNSVTKNSDNFIDGAHIRQEKGYMYFARLFNDSTVDVPEDFGRYVDKNNIDQHIAYLKKVNKL